jgi:hypothetical protein
LRLSAAQQQEAGFWNFPLSTYSVLGEKNVSQEKAIHSLDDAYDSVRQII